MALARNVTLALGILQAILLARWLGPGTYGIIVLITAIPDVIFGFTDVRASHATVKYIQEAQALNLPDRSAAVAKLGYSIDLVVASLTLLLVATVGPFFVGAAIRQPTVQPLVLLYALSFLPRSFATTSLSLLTIEGRFTAAAATEILSAFVRTAASLGLVALGWGIQGALIGSIVAGPLRGIVMTLCAQRTARARWGGNVFTGRLVALGNSWREIGRFIAFTDLATLIAVGMKQADVLVLGAWGGSEMAGIYRVAKNVPTVAGLGAGALEVVTYQRLTNRVARGDLALGPLIARLTSRIGVPLGLATLIGIPFLPIVIPSVLGPSYGGAITLAQLFTASAVVGGMLFWLRPVYLALGNPHSLAFGNAAMTIIYYGVGLALFGQLGPVGLAIGFVIANYSVAGFLALRQWQALNHP